MEKILLNDLLKVPQEDLITWKIKFNQYNGYSNPLELYKSNSEHVNTRWLLWRENRRYYRVNEVVIGLLKMSYDKWLLTSIKRITKDLNVKKDIGFEAEELKEYEPLYGRVILKFHKETRTQVFKAQNLMNELEVLEILPSIYDGDEFPGYDKVCLSYLQLKNIIQRGRENSWKAALENQKAVYLISDMANGKLYVGSATAKNGMLLTRWSNYISNGHGGDKELKQLITEKGIGYVKQNFQYSILENYNSRVDDQFILQRENWWKKIVLSKKFGYNDN